MRLDDKTEDWITHNRLPSVADPEGAIPVARFRKFVRMHTADLVVELVALAQSDGGASAEWIDLVVSVGEGMYSNGESLTNSIASDLRHQKTSTSSGASEDEC